MIKIKVVSVEFKARHKERSVQLVRERHITAYQVQIKQLS